MTQGPPVFIAHIDTPGQAGLAPRSVRFYQPGSGSQVAPAAPADGGTLPQPENLTSGNVTAPCIPQLESKPAIDNVEKIAATDGSPTSAGTWEQGPPTPKSSGSTSTFGQPDGQQQRVAMSGSDN
ncbi:hypothetical protein GCM10023346_38830 [Arthrobacter gyeryongensis]|uniref:Uncharacterized protein n=1 Tax=Arthrobacter gyeryongensis TaxID=1650592 RepID=A0ABP9SMX6_9MICC